MLNIKVSLNDVGGEVVKKDYRYTVTDNTHLKNLVVSSTKLNRNKETSGHKHDGQEEVYYFLEGSGTMWLDDKSMYITQGDVVLIEDGVFHKVKAGPLGLYFVCVFDGRRKH